MSQIAPIYAAANMRRVVASRRRRVADDWFTGNHCLTSDGSAGSWAAANTTAPGLIFMPGSVLGTGTFLCWVRDATPGGYWTVSKDTSGTRSYLRLTSGLSFIARTENNVSNTATQGSFSPATWTLVVATIAHAANDSIGVSHGGAAKTITVDTPADAWGTAAHMFLFRTHTGTLNDGDIRQPAIYNRVLSDAEIAALHALGPTHDLRVASGDYNGGGPVHWWPADGDTGTTVTDRGSVGGCNLTLNGNVTIAEAA